MHVFHNNDDVQSLVTLSSNAETIEESAISPPRALENDIGL